MKCRIFGIIADKKLESLGFVKKQDDGYGVRYERYNENYHYVHKIAILYRENDPSIILSYDPALMDQKGIGNTCVGLSREEAVAAAMKILSKGWK